MTDATRPYTISPVSQDEAAAFVRAVSRAFGRTEDDGEIAEMVEVELADPSLSLAARDAGTIIGTATVLDFARSVRRRDVGDHGADTPTPGRADHAHAAPA